MGLNEENEMPFIHKESRDFADMESLRHRASTENEKGLRRIKASPEEKPHLT